MSSLSGVECIREDRLMNHCIVCPRVYEEAKTPQESTSSSSSTVSYKLCINSSSSYILAIIIHRLDIKYKQRMSRAITWRLGDAW